MGFHIVGIEFQSDPEVTDGTLHLIHFHQSHPQIIVSVVEIGIDLKSAAIPGDASSKCPCAAMVSPILLWALESSGLIFRTRASVPSLHPIPPS